MPASEFAELIRIVEDHGLLLFSDEVYSRIRARPGPAPPRRLRPQRAGRLARRPLENLRPGRAANRLARHARPERPLPGRRDQGLHHDLQQRPERVPGRAGPPPPPAPRPPQPRDHPRQPRAPGRFLRPPSRDLRMAPPVCRPDRLPPPAHRGCGPASAATWLNALASCCSPARSTTIPGTTSGSASAAAACPRLWSGWRSIWSELKHELR